MSDEVVFTAKVHRFGGSLMVIIPSPIARLLKLKKGDIVKVIVRLDGEGE